MPSPSSKNTMPGEIASSFALDAASKDSWRLTKFSEPTPKILTKKVSPSWVTSQFEFSSPPSSLRRVIFCMSQPGTAASAALMWLSVAVAMVPLLQLMRRRLSPALERCAFSPWRRKRQAEYFANSRDRRGEVAAISAPISPQRRSSRIP